MTRWILFAMLAAALSCGCDLFTQIEEPIPTPVVVPTYAITPPVDGFVVQPTYQATPTFAPQTPAPTPEATLPTEGTVMPVPPPDDCLVCWIDNAGELVCWCYCT